MSKTKRIHFIRHGESFSNCMRRELGVHLLAPEQRPVVVDPGLTQQGVEQAQRLKDYLKTLHPQIAICSPYTRTLQTCLISHGSSNVVISPLCAEEMVGQSDDIGLPASCLKVAFPMFDFTSLDEIWWFTQDGINSQCEAVNLLTQGKLQHEPIDRLDKRAKEFYDLLQQIPEDNVVVFSHNDFLVFFLTKYFVFTDTCLDNCEIFSTNL